MYFESPPRFAYVIAGCAALLIAACIAWLVNWLLTLTACRVLVACVIGMIVALPLGGCTVDFFIYNKRQNDHGSSHETDDQTP